MSQDDRRSRIGKPIMVGSLRKERPATNPHIPKRGRHKSSGGGEISQAAQSQVVGPTHVLVCDEGYDPTDQHYIDGPEDPYFQLPVVEDDEAEGELEGEDQGAAHVVPVVSERTTIFCNLHISHEQNICSFHESRLCNALINILARCAFLMFVQYAFLIYTFINNNNLLEKCGYLP